jgi:hypothetical protein
MWCGRVETGGDRSLDSRRFSVFIVLLRVGVVNPPVTAFHPLSWGAKPYGCYSNLLGCTRGNSHERRPFLDWLL